MQDLLDRSPENRRYNNPRTINQYPSYVDNESCAFENAEGVVDVT